MNQFYISNTSITIIGENVGQKELEELKELVGEKISDITFHQHSGPSIIAKGFFKEDISKIWDHYEKKGFLGRRIGDVKV